MQLPDLTQLDTTLLLELAAVAAGTLVAYRLAGTLVERGLTRYPEDVRETVRIYSKVLVGFTGMVLLVVLVTTNFLILVGLAFVMLVVLLYAGRDLLRGLATRFYLLSSNDFNIGDYIEVVGVRGRVMKIDNLYTLLRRDDNTVACIPNSRVIRSTVINYTGADLIKLLDSVVLNVSDDQVPSVRERILTELATFGYTKPVPMVTHARTSDGVRFAVQLSVGSAVEAPSDVENLRKALTIVSGEYIEE